MAARLTRYEWLTGEQKALVDEAIRDRYSFRPDLIPGTRRAAYVTYANGRVNAVPYSLGTDGAEPLFGLAYRVRSLAEAPARLGLQEVSAVAEKARLAVAYDYLDCADVLKVLADVCEERGLAEDAEAVRRVLRRCGALRPPLCQAFGLPPAEPDE